MNALVRNAATTGRLSASAGRAPACRRLASQYSKTSSQTGAYLSSTTSSSAVLSSLRSPFVPSELRAITTPFTQTRSLHASSLRRQEQKPDAKAPPAPGSESVNKEGEAKTEEADQKAAKDEEGKKNEEGENGEKSEGKDGEETKEKKEDLPPPPPHGDKTPWQVFMDTMNTEFKASKEWNESTKQIADSTHDFIESERVRKAREAYQKSTGAVGGAIGGAVKTTASAVGKGAAWTWDTSVMKGVRKGANVTGGALDRATKPIRDTEAYKSVKETIDDGSSSRYGGWVEKEERRKRREEWEAKHGKQQVMQEDPEAGTNVTLHKDAAWKEAWRDFRDSNKFVQGVFGMRSKYDESENPLVSTARSITDRIGGWFAENENAQVIKRFRQMDPAFQVEDFLTELRQYILPEVLEAYVKGDTATLKLWLSEAQFSVYEALTKQYLQAGMKSDGRILDIRNVDILKARILDPGEHPVFIITCRTQEVHVYRNAKSNELAAGMEDKVQLVTYAIGITRTAEDVNNPETRGWRLIEMQKSGRDWY